ncbi:MAG: hypothetical protein IIB94_03855 [Candidatus Marinimicrobia bacterium]|nr:hypothetical protein [Candidatus Neomarinimicrobiota bacterium]
MSTAKIEFTIGGITFKGEGEEKWVATQLDFFLKKAPDLISLVPKQIISGDTPPGSRGDNNDIKGKTLPIFLKEKNATTNQVLKFLTSAVWLEAKGNKNLSTSDVTKALKDSNQSRLGNPADCLNQNIKKGFCEKDQKGFFVTQEGKDSL